jgi:phage-related minor tail protein
MAGKAATLNIDIVATAEKALSEFDKVKEKSTGSFSAMKVGATVASGAIIAGLTEATKSAAEHEAGVAKLDTAYKNAGISTDDMKGSLEEIEKQSRRTGQGTEDNIAAYTQLVTATRSTTKAHEELATAQDLAALKGISVSEAAMDITRAAGGNTRALKEMGIATKDTAGHQLSTQAIMEKLTAAVHGQADAFGDTAQGQMARFHESLDQTKEKIGEALLPALQSVLNILQPVFAWLTNNTALLQVLAPIIATVAGVVVALTLAMKVWTAVQWAVNLAMEANPIGIVIAAIAALIAIVVVVVHNWQFFQNIINDVWGALRGAGDWILSNWPLIVGALFGPIGIAVAYFLSMKNGINDIVDALERVGHAVSDALGWLGKLPSSAGSLLGKLNPFSLAAPAGAQPTMMVFNITATPGADLPETVYQALRDYQRRHVRPELRPLFS